MFMKEISIIILIHQRSESVGPVQQKIKLPLPWNILVQNKALYSSKRVSCAGTAHNSWLK